MFSRVQLLILNITNMKAKDKINEVRNLIECAISRSVNMNAADKDKNDNEVRRLLRLFSICLAGLKKSNPGEVDLINAYEKELSHLSDYYN